MAMRMSEFWSNVDAAFGAARGRSLAADMTLTALGSRTAAAALDDGEAPQAVWDAVVAQTDLPDRYRFLHLIDPDER